MSIPCKAKEPDKKKKNVEDRLNDLTNCTYAHAQDIDLLIERLQELEKFVYEDVKKKIGL